MKMFFVKLIYYLLRLPMMFHISLHSGSYLIFQLLNFFLFPYFFICINMFSSLITLLFTKFFFMSPLFSASASFGTPSDTSLQTFIGLLLRRSFHLLLDQKFKVTVCNFALRIHFTIQRFIIGHLG